MAHIGLIVTGKEALSDFRIFCKTLEVWHPDATLYIYTDSETAIDSVVFKGTKHVRVALDAYKGLTRSDMEARPGKLYDSLFKDYTYEKANVLDWMWTVNPTLDTTGAWFLDADICHLAPLPPIPTSATLALSPHMIRPVDEGLFGKYNAGFMWFKTRDFLDKWRAFASVSRFFEQAALEDIAVVAGSGLYEFPIQVNFGWWRMVQGTSPPPDIQGRFSFNRSDKSIGLRYQDKPLQSVHTHWFQTSGAAGYFNQWLRQYLDKFKTHPPIQRFLRSLV